jgi:hypothetical protein
MNYFSFERGYTPYLGDMIMLYIVRIIFPSSDLLSNEKVWCNECIQTATTTEKTNTTAS